MPSSSLLMLLGRPLVLAPAVEAAGEPLRLLVLEGEEELPRPLRLHALHVLNVHLVVTWEM